MPESTRQIAARSLPIAWCQLSVAHIAIYHRSRENRDMMAHSAFTRASQPEGFLVERVMWPGEDPRRMVRIHHKFIVIDAETASPIIFTSSANMSNNALYNNDENLLEISNSPRLAAIYLAEFLRLYEHYRARIAFERFASGQQETFKLTPDARWARKYYVPGAPESKDGRDIGGQVGVLGGLGQCCGRGLH